MAAKVRARAYCFTLNNYTDDDIAYLQTIDCRYIVYGKEVAPTTGTPHLQGYIYFKNQRTFEATRKLRAWSIRVAKGSPEQNYDYTTKDGDFYERGEKPEDPRAQGESERERWSLARTAAMEGRFTDIPDDMYVRYQSSFKRMRREDRPKPVDLERSETYGVWIWGPPRSGKSHLARTDYSPLYLKDINKWWDNYEGEDNVLIDELSPEHAPFMTTFLKKWVDRWTFSAEMKGGTTVIRPKKIIVTSNYSIEQVFKDRPQVDLDAMLSRFEVIFLGYTYAG